jgi:hypothetical protein
MILIAHRGLYAGSNEETENTPMQIQSALLAGFDVELDVWYLPSLDKWMLGHNSAQTPISEQSLCNSRFWIHAKSISTLHRLITSGLTACANVFFHNEDDATLTSDRYIWTYPKSTLTLTGKSIAVLPERTNWTPEQLSKAAGICSDYVAEYKKDLGFIPSQPSPVVLI